MAVLGRDVAAGPDIDSVIDKMLSDRDSGQPDPLSPGEFPSLGFPNERRGAYFMTVEQGGRMVSVWRIIGANGAPHTYHIHVYFKHVYEGVTSWGGKANDRITAEDLVQVQAIIHHIFTSGGNQGGDNGLER